MAHDIELINKVRELAHEGLSTNNIGKVLNLTKEQVKHIFKKNNISNGLKFEKGVVEIESRVHERTNGRFRYANGYKTVDNPIIIACNTCGAERIASAQFLRRNSIIRCYSCDEARKQTKLKEAFNSKIKRYILLSGIKLKLKVNKCTYCGKKFVDTKVYKYCSKQCVRRTNDLKKSDARRERIESNGIKENITLPRLFKRDKGVCHICKGKCDYNDYEIKGNAFYAKDNYPSRDHVIPLSKGGTHTWDNVKLAHMRCNTIKNNNTSIVIDKGRLRLDL